MINSITLIQLLCYTGNITSVIGGVLAAKKLKLHWSVQFLSGMSTTFFSGMFPQNLTLLQSAPTIFISPVEITTTAVVGIVTILLFKCREFDKELTTLLCIIDSIGMVGFIAEGYSRGTEAGTLIALSYSFATACGGSIIAAMIRGELLESLIKNKWNYLCVVFVSLVYVFFKLLCIDNNTTLISLIVISIIINLFIEGKVAKD